MKKPFLKKYLSYFTEFVLEETSSEFNPELYIILSHGRYQLCTKNAIYSYDDKYDNFKTAFQSIDVKTINPEKILLLGLGLGSIPFMLERIFKIQPDYIAIEIDPEICKLADKYILSDLESFVETFPVDAMDYFNWYEHTFDLIAMDIFQSAIIPVQFETIEFIQMLKSRLNKDGIALYNRLNDSQSNQSKNEIFEKTWKKVFPKGGSILSKNNQIFINDVIHIKE